MSNARLTNVELLKSILIASATGQGADDVEYRKLRTWLLADRGIAALAPSWLRSHRDLSEFWSLIKPKFAHYEERRQWLRSEFEPLLAKLESTSDVPSDESTTSLLDRNGSSYV